MTDPYRMRFIGFRTLGLSAGAMVLLLPHLYYLSKRVLEA